MKYTCTNCKEEFEKKTPFQVTVSKHPYCDKDKCRDVKWERFQEAMDEIREMDEPYHLLEYDCSHEQMVDRINYLLSNQSK